MLLRSWDWRGHGLGVAGRMSEELREPRGSSFHVIYRDLLFLSVLPCREQETVRSGPASPWPACPGHWHCTLPWVLRLYRSLDGEWDPRDGFLDAAAPLPRRGACSRVLLQCTWPTGPLPRENPPPDHLHVLLRGHFLQEAVGIHSFTQPVSVGHPLGGRHLRRCFPPRPGASLPSGVALPLTQV